MRSTILVSVLVLAPACAGRVAEPGGTPETFANDDAGSDEAEVASGSGSVLGDEHAGVLAECPEIAQVGRTKPIGRLDDDVRMQMQWMTTADGIDLVLVHLRPPPLPGRWVPTSIDVLPFDRTLTPQDERMSISIDMDDVAPLATDGEKIGVLYAHGDSLLLRVYDGPDAAAMVGEQAIGVGSIHGHPRPTGLVSTRAGWFAAWCDDLNCLLQRAPLGLGEEPSPPVRLESDHLLASYGHGAAFVGQGGSEARVMLDDGADLHGLTIHGVDSGGLAQIVGSPWHEDEAIVVWPSAVAPGVDAVNVGRLREDGTLVAKRADAELRLDRLAAPLYAPPWLISVESAPSETGHGPTSVRLQRYDETLRPVGVGTSIDVPACDGCWTIGRAGDRLVLAWPRRDVTTVSSKVEANVYCIPPAR